LTRFGVAVWHTKCDKQDDDAIVRAVATERIKFSPPDQISEVTMKRYGLTLLTLLAICLGTPALAEDETQTAASTDAAAAASDSSATATDTSTDPAADAPAAATESMPMPADSDSK
jgi:hypothetical protein